MFPPLERIVGLTGKTGGPLRDFGQISEVVKSLSRTDIYSRDGTRLAFNTWEPAGGAAAQVLISHGFGEHASRFDWLASQFTAAGIRVGCADYRGMGRSDGMRSRVRDYDEYLDDLGAAETALRSEADSLPLFVYGHSMGGLIALLRACRADRPALAGTLLSGPALQFALPIPAWQIALGRLFVGIAPDLPVPAPLPVHILTHDAQRQRELGEDPLSLNQLRLCWYFATQRAMQLAHTREPLAPTCWLLPGDDQVCSSPVSRGYYQRLAAEGGHALHEFPGLYHELHQETEADRLRVAAQAVQWIQQRLAADRQQTVTGTRPA